MTMSENTDKQGPQLKVLLMEVGKANLREQVGFNEFHYNLALGCLARAARSQNGANIHKDNVRIFFQYRETDDEMVLKAEQFDPDVIGFTCYTNNWPKTEEIAKRIKDSLTQKGDGKKRWFILGGVHATTSYPQILSGESPQPKKNANDGQEKKSIEPLFDCIVLGEGEMTFVELLNRFIEAKNAETPTGPESWKDVKGIAFLDTGGNPIHTNPRKRLNNLDFYKESCGGQDGDQSSPVRPPESFALAKNVFPAVPGSPPFASIFFSRGCMGKCTFCSNPVMYPKGARFREAVDIFNEMKTFRHKTKHHGTRRAQDWYVDDEDVFSNIKTLWELCGMLENENRLPAEGLPKITWMGLASIRNSLAAINTHPDWFKKLHAAGCVMLGFGLESGSAHARKTFSADDKKNFHKGFTDAEAKKVINAAFKSGIIPVGFFLLGTPEETVKSLRATFKFASKLKCLRYRFSYLYPYPGTVLSKTIKWIDEKYAQPQYAALNIPVVRCKATDVDTDQHLTKDEFAATGSAFLKAIYESDAYAKNVNDFLVKNQEWSYSIRVKWRGIAANDIIAGYNPKAYKRLQELDIIPKGKEKGTPEDDK
jgi:radical SAM superfamily enzyme YgiQ (UPF0313 family)